MPERRTTPRTRIALTCTLSRRQGSPIQARTIDLGPGGMRVISPRPLDIDEVIAFEVPLRPDEHVDGQARVLRQHGFEDYALRFEGLAEAARMRLEALALTLH